MTLTAGPVPLYYQLAEALRGQIVAGELRPGDVLPTEEKLCEQYGVSRITVRRAQDDLIAEGLIVRRRGVGTFVAEPREATRSVSLVGSLYDALDYPPDIAIEVFDSRYEAAGAREAESLNIAQGSQVLAMDALSRVGDAPFATTTFYFPADVAAGVRPEDLTTGTPVARLVERYLGESVVRAEQMVEPDSARGRIARRLDLRTGTPVLHVWRVYYTEAGRPVEVASVRYRPDQYRLRVQLLAGTPAAGAAGR
ncbi:GntR family transcriptional regulator [Algiphilus sp.]|uniref:GntR family transcriptional regulator n=1 Tax=Algiphilus sp. TaxID=1872431 RepID=UPI003C36E600